MKLRLNQYPRPVHGETVTSAGWTVTNELFSVSDDLSIRKWNMEGEPQGKVTDLPTYVTAFHWFPASSRRQQHSGDVFAISCTDGSFVIMTKSGTVEKNVPDAHKGAVTCLKWSLDGTGLVTGGEDGSVKLWSRSGMPRSTLSTNESAVYAVTWSPNGDSVLYACGQNIICKPLQPSAKQTQWKAHEGIVLSLDWNPVNGLIVSGGEDLRYRVWDSYGRVLFKSPPNEFSITCVSWAPHGDYFAVGSFDMIRLCDRTGWAHSREQPDSGSIYHIAWTSDGTQIAASGGNGAVVFGQVVERVLEWKNLRVTLAEANHIVVYDVITESKEYMDFQDRVVKMSLSYGHLIVITATQCLIYPVANWSTPQTFEIKETVSLLVPAESCFLICDSFTGVQVYSYDGRLMANPKSQGIRIELLNEQSVSLSNDVLAIVDSTDPKNIRLFNPTNGQPLKTSITHSLDVMEVSVDNYGPYLERKLCFIDRNKDLYLTPILRPEVVKLATMTDSVVWNDATGLLAALSDNRFVVWYYPQVAYVDRGLLNQTKVAVPSEVGQNAQFLSFFGTLCNIRRSDGALVNSSISSYPLVLYELIERNEWDRAVRLCRFVKDQTLWACLAGMAVNAKELNKAEVAFAEINEVDKLYYILHIKDIPTEEGRNAELELYKRRPDEAEKILIQANLIYRCIQMHCRLFNWDRALDIAIQYKTHVDTVLALRNNYLRSCRKQETNKRFLQYAQDIQLDWEQIRAKIEAEKEKERQRPGAQPL